ncbi:MAG: 5-formyltetrahydrofolate cyclo-ligase [Clostridia bacterium]|nr:5-formyltetrahydrofolate cyclo-ligase [Clostridia bacterium]
MRKNMKEFKIYLRKKYRSIRENMDLKIKKIWDSKILKKVTILSRYKNCNTILTYISKDIEVDTLEIINKAWEDGKKVAVPACDKETMKMNFYEINSMDDLEKGTFGLLEPKKDICKKIEETQGTLCFVPGFSFDQEGFRLGYGYGYYDRFLQNFKGTKIGICYNNCITNKLPHGRYDCSVDILITNAFIKEIHSS